MNKDIKKSSPKILPDRTAIALTQTGNKNTQVAHANNVNNVTNINFFMQSRADDMANTTNTINTEYYNLFVLQNETFSNGFFNLLEDRVFIMGTSPETKSKFSDLSDDTISQIKRFPTIFANENHHYGKTDAEHLAYFGFVTDMIFQDNGISVYFHLHSSIPQQKLNDLAYRFALQHSRRFSELNRIHWAIKKVNLLEEFKAAGISIPPLI